LPVPCEAGRQFDGRLQDSNKDEARPTMETAVKIYKLATTAACLAGTVLALSACASTSEMTSRSMGRADRAIELAEESGAQEYASTTLAQAREKASAAESALEENEEVRAQRFAEQAEVEAELAFAQTNRRKTEESLMKMNESIADLQDELERNQEFEAQ
jgi:hypothetical protein